MALIDGQQLGSQVQHVENSVWAKYMGGLHGQKSVWVTAHGTQPTLFRRLWGSVSVHLWGNWVVGPHLTQSGRGRGLLPSQVSS